MGTYKLNLNYFKPDYDQVQILDGYEVSYHVKRFLRLLKNKYFLDMHFPNIMFDGKKFLFKFKDSMSRKNKLDSVLKPTVSEQKITLFFQQVGSATTQNDILECALGVYRKEVVSQVYEITGIISV